MFRERINKPVSLQNILRQDKLFSKISEFVFISKDWESIVGEKIAQNCRPLSIYGTKLYINVANSTWMNHLQFYKSEIFSKIRAYFNGKTRIKEIVFRIGSIDFKENS